MDFTPRTSTVLQILKKHWHIIVEIPGCESFPLVGFRKTQSLRELLVRANLSTIRDRITTNIVGHHRCGQRSICPLPIETKSIDFPDKGLRQDLVRFMNCKTRMCIYMIKYGCALLYFSSTRRQQRVRIQEH